MKNVVICVGVLAIAICAYLLGVSQGDSEPEQAEKSAPAEAENPPEAAPRPIEHFKPSAPEVVEKEKVELGGKSFKMPKGAIQAMGPMISGMRKSEIDGLTKLLNLTPEQVAALKEHFAKQNDIVSGVLGLAMRRLSGEGEMSEEEKAEMGEAMKNISNEDISALLTPEQLETYNEYKEQKKERAKESAALREFASVQQEIDMTEEQKDAVYEILYENGQGANQSALAVPPAASGENGFSMDAVLENKTKQDEQLLERMGTVLDEDQVDQYRSYQEGQREVLRGATSIFNLAR